jgi:hypothetical protein
MALTRDFRETVQARMKRDAVVTWIASSPVVIGCAGDLGRAILDQDPRTRTLHPSRRTPGRRVISTCRDLAGEYRPGQNLRN